ARTGSGSPAPATKRLRSAGRTSTSSNTDTTRNTAPSAHSGQSSSQLDPAAASAPPLSISRNMSPVSASAPASTSAAINQTSGTGIPPAYREPNPHRGQQLHCEHHVVLECDACCVGQ